MKTLSGKDRVYAALRREPVDRVPIFMWFHPETTKRLAKLAFSRCVPPQTRLKR